MLREPRQPRDAAARALVGDGAHGPERHVGGPLLLRARKALGDGGCWRPVTGDDIVGLGGLDATDWASTAHATHQDPSGISCQLFAQGVPADVLDKNGLTTQDVLLACYHRLSVANQHGYCVFGVNVCPMAAPSFIDACEQINLDESRSGC